MNTCCGCLEATTPQGTRGGIEMNGDETPRNNSSVHWFPLIRHGSGGWWSTIPRLEYVIIPGIHAYPLPTFWHSLPDDKSDFQLSPAQVPLFFVWHDNLFSQIVLLEQQNGDVLWVKIFTPKCQVCRNWDLFKIPLNWGAPIFISKDFTTHPFILLLLLLPPPPLRPGGVQS